MDTDTVSYDPDAQNAEVYFHTHDPVRYAIHPQSRTDTSGPDMREHDAFRRELDGGGLRNEPIV